MHEGSGGADGEFRHHHRDHSATFGEAIIVDHLRSVDMRPAQSVIYDREIELRELYQDPVTGAKHYLIRYPAGLKARLRSHDLGARGQPRSEREGRRGARVLSLPPR